MSIPDTSSGTLYIDGKWQPAASGRTFESTNPATSEVLGKVSDADTADVKAAIAAAEAAFPAWSARTAYERADILYKAYQIMIGRLDDLARLMTTEQGKPLRTARIEAQYAADFLIWFAEEAKRVYGQTIPSHRPEQRFMVQHQAVGVVGAITPWNYPTSMLTRKLGPALAAGCTVVLKPAEQTPLCAMEIIKILHEAGVPAGVVNLVTTNTPSVVGDEFMANPAVRKLAFTGSTEVGKMLAAGAAGHIKRVSLELGGHAPFIVFPDVDPSRAATGASLVKFLNTGQACICPNRIYVHRSMIDKFTETLTSRVGRLKVGQRPAGGHHHRPAHRRARHGQDGPARVRRRQQGRDGGPGRRAADRRELRQRHVLRAHRAHRRHPGHAHLPRGDLRADRPRHPVR